MASREKEQAEQVIWGQLPIWEQWSKIRIAVNALTTQQWSDIAAQIPGMSGITKAQAVAFMQARETEAFVPLIGAVNDWRLTP